MPWAFPRHSLTPMAECHTADASAAQMLTPGKHRFPGVGQEPAGGNRIEVRKAPWLVSGSIF
jgi:hypothetical protein